MTNTGSVASETDPPLTHMNHLDPNKHLIGEAIGVPSVDLASFAGANNSVGTSPFPARANHSHDIQAWYGMTRSSDFSAAGGITVPAGGGTAFVNDLVWWQGSNLLVPASTQLMLFPAEGAWFIVHMWTIVRVGGGVFTQNYDITYFFDNAATSDLVERAVPANNSSSTNGQTVSPVFYNSVNGNFSNFQARWTNWDVVNWKVYTKAIVFYRMSSYYDDP